MNTIERPRKLSSRGQRFRRRRRVAMAVLSLCAALTVATCVYLLADFSPDTVSERQLAARDDSAPKATEDRPSSASDKSDSKASDSRQSGSDDPVEKGTVGNNEPEPTIAGVAYESVASELPRSDAEDVKFTQVSVLDPSWATVRLDTEDENESYYAIFLRKILDKKSTEWRVVRSVRIENQNFPKDVKTLLTDVPEDLTRPILPDDKDVPEPEEASKDRAVQFVRFATGDEDWTAVSGKSDGEFHDVQVEKTSEDSPLRTHVYLRGKPGSLDVVAVGNDLTSAEATGFPKGMVEETRQLPESEFEKSPATVTRDGGRVEGGSESGVEQAVEDIEDYPGIAGFYAYDLKSGSGYGVRANEDFFSASTIKVAVMAAVYRRIEEGELSYSDQITTTEDDWAAGAGWLRWETPGATSTVEDSLWLMMTQSDNVATNALTRLVGGPEYVNAVARDLGAEDTNLYWKLSSERGAVPSLDNRSTPRDMATVLASIYEGEGMSDFSRDEMIGLMEQNSLEYWMEAGVPNGIVTANKGGWLDATYNDVGIVEYEERPYVLVTFTKYGDRMREGGELIGDVSRDVWLAQTGMTKKEYEDRQKEKDREAEREAERGSEKPDSQPNGGGN